MKKYALPLFLLLLCGCNEPPQKSARPVIVTATQATLMNIPIYRDYVGHGDANSSVDVYAQVSGKLMSQHFTSGELVNAGDILYTIDSRAYIASLKKAHSALEKNTATIRMAKEKAETYTELIKDDIISQLDFDQALTDVLTLDADIETNIADIDLATLNIRWCTVRSPITGIPSMSSLGTGTYVSIGGSTPLVTIKQVVPIATNIYVPEAQYLKLRKLKENGPVRVQAFSIEETPRVYEGILTLMDNAMNKKTGTMKMQASFPNKNATMWPNEYFVTRIHYGVVKNATVIPEECIIKTQKGNQVYVIKKDNTVEARLVTTGESYRNLIIIEKGIKEGEVVVLEGQINLSPGSAIVIKSHKPIPVEEIEKECPEAPKI